MVTASLRDEQQADCDTLRNIIIIPRCVNVGLNRKCGNNIRTVRKEILRKSIHLIFFEAVIRYSPFREKVRSYESLNYGEDFVSYSLLSLFYNFLYEVLWQFRTLRIRNVQTVAI